MEALNWLTSEERSRSLCALVVGEVLMGEGENENGEWLFAMIAVFMVNSLGIMGLKCGGKEEESGTLGMLCFDKWTKCICDLHNVYKRDTTSFLPFPDHSPIFVYRFRIPSRTLHNRIYCHALQNTYTSTHFILNSDSARYSHRSVQSQCTTLYCHSFQ